MKKVQEWIDLWTMSQPGSRRPIFVGQLKAMLAEVFSDLEYKAAKNGILRNPKVNSYHLALEQARKEIEELK